jgi:hypothetical protein
MNVSKLFLSLLPLCETLTYRTARDNYMNITKLTYKAGQSSQADDFIYQEPPKILHLLHEYLGRAPSSERT